MKKGIALFLLCWPFLLIGQHEPDSIVNLFYYKYSTKSTRNLCDSGYVRTTYDFEGLSDKDMEGYYKEAVTKTHPDSLRSRARLLNWVSHFEENPALGAQARQLFDSLKTVYIEDMYNKLTGTWQWNWDGSNWGTSDMPKDCQCAKTLRITRDSFYFYYENELKLRRAYTPVQDDYTVGMNFFVVSIDGECWIMSVTNKPNYYWGGLGSTANTFLNVNEMAGCACGCPTTIYEKKE